MSHKITDQQSTPAERDPAAELAEARRALAEAEKRAAEAERLLAFERTAEPLIIYDRKGVARRANRAALEAYGFDPAGYTRAELADRARESAQDGQIECVEQQAADLQEATLRLEEVVAERLQVEESLRQSEHRYRSVVEDQTEMIARLRAPDGAILFANEAWTQLFGSAEGGCAWSVIHPEDRDRVEARLRSLTPEDPVGRTENRVISARGDVQWTAWVDRGFFDAEGRLIEWQMVGRDVTDLKRIEQALHESEERFRTAFDNLVDEAGVASAIRNGNGRIVDFRWEYVNQALCRGNGFTREQMLSHTLLQLLPGHLEAGLFDHYCRVVETGEPYVVDGLHYEGNVPGGRRLFDVDVRAAKLGDGLVLSRRDVSARVQADQARRASEEALRLSEERFRLALKNGSIGVAHFDRDLRYTWAHNARMATGDFLGKTIAEVVANPAEAVPVMDMMRRVLSGGRGAHGTFRFTSPDDERRFIDIAVEPLLDADGRIVGLASTSSDVTELKRAEQEIRKLNGELEERVRRRTAELQAVNAELESFSYTVSHDLRAPLRAITGFAALVQEEADGLGDETRRKLQVVRDNAVRMGDLIDGLLTFSRLGRTQLVPMPLDLGDMAREVFQQLVAFQPQARARLELHDLPPASGDPSLLRQLFQNLLENAIKFSSGQDEPLIEVGGERRGDELVYWVRDHGVGFDMDYAHKLFTVFQRLHSSDEFEGTGVGLAFVKRIVERHGGRVWAEGQEGHGATFYFTLPAK